MLKLSLFRLLILPLIVVASAADICTDSGTECKNGGNCDSPPAECKCTGGYTGDTCETAPAAAICTGSGGQCQNGGTCETTKHPAVCKCTSGYTGDTCETAPAGAICTTGENECLHGGTCDTTKPTAECKCTGGYTGDTCQNGAVVVRMSAYYLILGLVSYWISARAHIV